MTGGEEIVPVVPPLDARRVMWFRGLVRYLRDIELIHPVEGTLPRSATLFCGLTFRLANRLQLLFPSNQTSRHSQYIDAQAEVAAPYDRNVRLVGGVTLKLVNGFSPEPSLLMHGSARQLTDAEQPAARLAWNAIRDLKDWPQIDIDEKRGPKEVGRTMYAVDVTYAETQDYSRYPGDHYFDDARPAVDPNLLRDFDKLPATEGHVMPLTIDGLFAHFAASGYQVPPIPGPK